MKFGDKVEDKKKIKTIADIVMDPEGTVLKQMASTY